MAKKIFYAGLVSIVLLFTANIVFASSESESTKTTSLGNEVTTSIDGTEERVDNLVDNKDRTVSNTQNVSENVGDTIKDGARDVGNAISNGVEDIKDGAENLMDGNNNTSSKAQNNVVAGTTGNYASGEQVTNNSGISGTAWVWIILAVIAIIIIAAVWYYAAQK
jgi:gas vesicle protein